MSNYEIKQNQMTILQNRKKNLTYNKKGKVIHSLYLQKWAFS